MRTPPYPTTTPPRFPLLMDSLQGPVPPLHAPFRLSRHECRSVLVLKCPCGLLCPWIPAGPYPTPPHLLGPDITILPAGTPVNPTVLAPLLSSLAATTAPSAAAGGSGSSEALLAPLTGNASYYGDGYVAWSGPCPNSSGFQWIFLNGLKATTQNLCQCQPMQYYNPNLGTNGAGIAYVEARADSRSRAYGRALAL